MAPALRGYTSEFHIGFALLVIRQRLVQPRPRLLQVRLGLVNLIVQLGRFNLGNRLARSDAVAKVHHAALQVSVGAGQNGGLSDGLDVSWQLQLTRLRRAAYLDDFYTRQSVLVFLGLPDNESASLPEGNITGKK